MLKNLYRRWLMYTTSRHFFKELGYWPNITSPKTYNEKIQYRKFYIDNPLYTVCSDKYGVRDFVKSHAGEEYLIPLIDIVDKPEQLQLEQYGEHFVVKPTHTTGGIFICKNGNYNKKKMFARLRKKLRRDFGKKSNEPWYSPIKPQIMVEKMLMDEQGNPPSDYKFHVFNDDHKTDVFLHIDYDRQGDHHRSIYTESGELTEISQRKPNKFTELVKPKNYDLMVEISKKLAAPFDYVRVDLYNVDGQIYVGELTFAHASGFGKFTPEKYDREWGDMWKIKDSK